MGCQMIINKSKSTRLKTINCKDHTLTGEAFELRYNSDLEMFYTHPQPSEKKLPKYYKSDTYISHTDARRSLSDYLYQLVKKYTIRNKVKLINSFRTPHKSLLDIGCGTGDFLFEAQRASWQILGVEPDTDARKLANQKINQSSLILASIEDVLKNSTKKRTFDVITLWHVLEHVSHLETYIQKLKDLLSENGFLIIAVPNYKSHDAEHYKNFWAAYDVPRHLWHFSQQSIYKLFKKQHMEVIQTLPMKFDSYYVSLLSEKYKTGKSKYLSAFWRGFLSNWKARKTKEYSSLIYVLKKR